MAAGWTAGASRRPNEIRETAPTPPTAPPGRLPDDTSLWAISFARDARGALVLMALWPAALLFPAAVPFGLGQVLESFILTPRLVGERIGLNPLAVIFALLAFGQLFGFAGVLAALPLSALALVAARRVLKRYLASELYLG